MKTTIENITDYLEKIAPLKYQESYDNAGLLVGSKKQEITGILITLDSTEKVLDEAIENNCNLIIAHHPIIFTGLKKLNDENYIQRVISKAIKNDIAIYASHTNLDSISTGVNKKISDKLQLKNLEFLSEKSKEEKIGAGMIGNLTKPMTTQGFLTHLKKSMDLICIRHTEIGDKKIQKVAVCGGSGSFLLKDAITKNADAFVTSDFKYHEFFDGENNTLIADIGHYESEVYTKDLFYEFLTQKFSNIAVLLSNVNTNPISYYI